MSQDRRTFLRNAGLTLGSALAPALPASAFAAGGAPDATTYDFDTLPSRVGIDSTKWDEQIRVYGKEHMDVGMGIADMDFALAPFITKALVDRIQRDNMGYMTTPQSHTEAIVAWNKRRYGLDIDPKTVVHSPAAHPAIIAALRAFSPAGTRVLMPSPSYSGFYSDIRVVGCTPADVPFTLRDGRYSMDFEALERTIAHDTNTLILCNPQNPTGNVWSKQDLLTLGEICLKHRVVVLADEIHCDFVHAGSTYTPFASLPNEAVVRNSITFKSASKSFNLIGTKCAYFFTTNPDYKARVLKWHRDEISTLGMVAHRTAYTEGDAWLDQLRTYIDANLTFVDEYMRKNVPPLVTMVKPQGTYLAWLDVSGLVEKVGARRTAAEQNRTRDAALAPLKPSNIMQQWFIDHARVQLNAGAPFGTGGEERMRMNCATSRAMLRKALDNIATAVKAV
ncbi:MAG: aminotransferase class I/II-fold pyridoxal phosphate-dependent enzyme [Vicinamibacterales bacterium]